MPLVDQLDELIAELDSLFALELTAEGLTQTQRNRSECLQRVIPGLKMIRAVSSSSASSSSFSSLSFSSAPRALAFTTIPAASLPVASSTPETSVVVLSTAVSSTREEPVSPKESAVILPVAIVSSTPQEPATSMPVSPVTVSPALEITSPICSAFVPSIPDQLAGAICQSQPPVPSTPVGFRATADDLLNDIDANPEHYIHLFRAPAKKAPDKRYTHVYRVLDKKPP